MNSWGALWHHFTATLAQQPVAAVLAVWLGLALVVVMALEGLLLNLFPRCAFHRYLEKMPDLKSGEGAPLARPAPVMTMPVAPAPPQMPVEMPAPPAAVEAPAEPVSKMRKNRNRKKPAPGPKTLRAATIRQRTPPLRERLSQGMPRLLTPKN